jgi:hypothetical protein
MKLKSVCHKRFNKFHSGKQGCQMVYLQSKNLNFGIIWRRLEWKMLVYFMVIWYNLRLFGIFYGYLVFVMAVAHGGLAQWTSHPPQEREGPGSNPARV